MGKPTRDLAKREMVSKEIKEEMDRVYGSNADLLGTMYEAGKEAVSRPKPRKYGRAIPPPDAPPRGDAVVLPRYYARYPIEPVFFSMENGLDPFQFNIVKYVVRHDEKHGIQDLEKAQRYLEMYIKFLRGDPNWSK